MRANLPALRSEPAADPGPQPGPQPGSSARASAFEAGLFAGPPPRGLKAGVWLRVLARRAYLQRQFSGAHDRRPDPGLLKRVEV